jgi:hypothetical protein
MSPGTFYGRPGEVPTFINAAVGAPLAMRGGGGADRLFLDTTGLHLPPPTGTTTAMTAPPFR